MCFWKRKTKEQWTERRIEAYRLTSKGYDRLSRGDNPSLSYEGALILGLLKDGRYTAGDIAMRCGHATGGYVRHELEKLILLNLIVRDDVVERARIFR